ncbi:Chemotaxis protein [Desulfonema limicola]|uniref:Chemotaxis protein n=2 Tax=Desulfonema limicola TaxID=45656 RepID=A0A975BDY2_9BACT|nr:Chemotaxis protein [Desulfonema limicola]
MTADDSASIRQMLAFCLKKGNYQVTGALDGQEAYEKIQTISVDMLITDIDMPRMNGIQLIQNVRSLPQYRRIPILILTTQSDSTIKIKAKSAGASGWIVKPFTPAQLLKLVEKFFD